MTGPEPFLLIAGVLGVTFGVLRIAFCRVARQTRDLMQRGHKDGWL